MIKRNILLFVLITVITLPSIIFPSGFAIYEHGIRANGFAGAFTGLANDASAIYYNPAGLSFLTPGNHMLFGSTIITPSLTWKILGEESSFYSVKEADTKFKVFPPINLHYAKTNESGISWGIGLYNPFGLGVFWPDEPKEDWPGRFSIVEINLETFFLTPTLSYKVSDQLSVAVGLNLAHAKVALKKRSKTPVGVEPLVDLNGSGNGIGFNLGGMYKVSDDLSFGVNYRHSLPMDLEGDAEITDAGVLADLLPSGKISTSITMPKSLTLGVSYKLGDKLRVNADYMSVGWSSFDSLIIDFETNTDLLKDERSPKLYEDTWNVRIGAEYQYSDVLSIQIGYLYDKTPVPDEYFEPLLPDADRNGFAIGFDYKLNEKLSLNFSYLHLLISDRESDLTKSKVEFNGSYSAFAPLIGLGIGYDF